MPFISTKLSVPLTAEKEAALKSSFGKAIEMLPGKTERWLMLDFTDNCRLWFAGDSGAPTAYVEVNIYGSADAASYNRLTGEITRILGNELGIAADRVYVKYEETENWGWNGGNF